MADVGEGGCPGLLRQGVSRFGKGRCASGVSFKIWRIYQNKDSGFVGVDVFRQMDEDRLDLGQLCVPEEIDSPVQLTAYCPRSPASSLPLSTADTTTATFFRLRGFMADDFGESNAPE